MKEFIKVIAKDKFLLNKELLGLEKAQLWIGGLPDGPADNNDKRVMNDRIKEQEGKDSKEWRISGIEAQDIEESADYPGWYEVDTAKWIPGVYRFNIHGHPYIQAPKGTPLRPIRDGQYSWPAYSSQVLMNFPDEQKEFLYLEKNNAGHCMRIEITKDRKIKPAGDGLKWVDKWPEIKKKIEKHYNEKIDLAKKTK